MARIFLEAGAATRPVPRGAGIKRTETLPQVPESFMGICVKNCEHRIVSKKIEQKTLPFSTPIFLRCAGAHYSSPSSLCE